MRFQNVAPNDQRASLKVLAGLVNEAITSAQPGVSTEVRRAALRIRNHVPNKDYQGELEAIYNAIHSGTTAVPGLEHGLHYVRDPILFDHFTAPHAILQELAQGINGEDCDGHAGLVSALAGSVGFESGVRMVKPAGESTFVHVYSIVRDPNDPNGTIIPIDTTEDGGVGWEVPGQYVDEWVT